MALPATMKAAASMATHAARPNRPVMPISPTGPPQLLPVLRNTTMTLQQRNPGRPGAAFHRHEAPSDEHEQEPGRDQRRGPDQVDIDPGAPQDRQPDPFV